jgi:hypothetical protein
VGTMYGRCEFTRPVVFEEEEGSGVGSVDSLYYSQPVILEVTSTIPTAIVSFTSCGRLESLSAAATEDAWREVVQMILGVRTAAKRRLEESRRVMFGSIPRIGGKSPVIVAQSCRENMFAIA